MRSVLFVGAFNLLKDPDQFGGQVTACTSLIEYASFNDHVNWHLIDTVSQSKSKGWKFISRIYKLFKNLLFKRIDTVLIFSSYGHSFLEKCLFAIICKKFGKKVILFPRSGYIRNNLIEDSFYRSLFRITIRNLDYLICQSEYWKIFYSSYSKKNEYKLKIIYNWIDFSKYKIKKQFDSNKTPKLLFLARVTREKGIFLILEVMQMMLKQFPDLHLFIAGTGPDLQAATALIGAKNLSNNVTIKGSVGLLEKNQLLNYCDVFLLPSDFEGLPNSLLECMNARMLVIASSVGSINDIITNHKNGYLIPPNHRLALYKTLKYVLENFNGLSIVTENAHNTVTIKNDLKNNLDKLKDLILS